METTAGIKQGCKLAPTLFSVLTGKLLHSLIQTFGWDTVQKFFAGYADDFTMHRTIRSPADPVAAHKLILRLLEAVKALQLRVNQAKCAMLVKLSGREAANVLQRHTCWLPDADGVLQRHWRLGRHKSWPVYRWESQVKYLGPRYTDHLRQLRETDSALPHSGSGQETPAGSAVQSPTRGAGQAANVVYHSVGHACHGTA